MYPSPRRRRRIFARGPRQPKGGDCIGTLRVRSAHTPECLHRFKSWQGTVSPRSILLQSERRAARLKRTGRADLSGPAKVGSMDPAAAAAAAASSSSSSASRLIRLGFSAGSDE
ncbi:hypothetical protein NL676_037047 [Syzygium grande]|nr:hypothetical protein NL676_037047 [Syzygium grande]